MFVTDAKDNWRIQPEISGGGYFYDLAPHHNINILSRSNVQAPISKNTNKPYPLL